MVTSPFPTLERFEFETATLVRVRRGLFWLDVTWETRWEQGEAEYFSEDLGNGITLEMVKIPGGEFLMGLAVGQIGTYAELPRHRVTVPPFFMGKFAVTQAQYKAVMGKTVSGFKGANLPVDGLSWNGAVEFCERLSQKTGHTYRLPSEAEWEYACRAGTTTHFHSGDRITTDLANFEGDYDPNDRRHNYGLAPRGESRRRPTEVGSFPPNAFGLYDMHGNVWEWCQDFWHHGYEGAPIDGSAWTTIDGSAWITIGEKIALFENNPDVARAAWMLGEPQRHPRKYHVLRGGNWYSYVKACCSSTRWWETNWGGVRVVLGLT